ncbi:hypothetical protein GGTG_02411 [Gaeumannomyces tritici R3-111a-1]|uniref:Heavy metal tolerance protein n=1 Tax=Gaeumannomyces tritici (strain R3-111a-1) TaxID=644352 RepID=J3NMA7_GAET3|nr:hypothetical protein GGTG_02411 [Gaeumannomyces tritici R3-111a-1]EJT82438.1 hypothetical protein GGTG_02411 [Gaeumannomyces tritici R3-111a-1]
MARPSFLFSKSQPPALEADVEPGPHDERQPLLGSTSASKPRNGDYRRVNSHDDEEANRKYGSTDGSDSDPESDSEYDSEDEEVKQRRQAKRIKELGGWWRYLADFFSVFGPFLVPRGDVKVQLCILVCVVCVAAQRVLTVMIPNQLGAVANAVLGSGADGVAAHPPYRELAVWVGLSVLSGGSILGFFEQVAKVPVRQFSERAVARAAFGHVMGLSMDFHGEHDTAEVMKTVEQGTALMHVLDRVLLEVAPTVVDLATSVVVLGLRFDWTVAGLMAFAFVGFMSMEAWCSSRWRVGPRRVMARAEREQTRVMHGAIQGWQSAHLFGALGREKTRFGDAVEARLRAERGWTLRDSGIEAVFFIFEPLTFAGVAAIILRRVVDGSAKPGDFVFFIDYWQYLIWPLKFIMQDYRQVLSDMVDAEQLLVLLRTKATVQDKPGAGKLGDDNDDDDETGAVATRGCVAFEDVGFEYDGGERGQAAIAGLSFSVAPGETVGLVGASGAGKSTILKLLLRFYDVSEGRVSIDGRDVRDVTLESLRAAFGVVPQEPQLFDASVLENVRYARPDATDAEVRAACAAAAIHGRVMGFRDGYQTRVGEGGVKLSGGEAQRLAVARALLRDPAILVLDEATSSVDSGAEAEIQEALEAFRRQRARTTFIVAHRLSTVVSADRILVIDKGRCVESGTHAELLSKKGRYAELWNKQTGGS